MKYIIIAFVVLSLIGSVMWVMPTKRDRFLADLRMQAKRLGFLVQLIKLTFPREQGVLEPRAVSTVAYRLLRGKIDQTLHNNWNSWRVVRCETSAKDGLVSGWGWIVGEHTIGEEGLKSINQVLGNLPDEIIGLESTPVHVSAYWNESQQEMMFTIEKKLKQMIELKI